MGDAEIKVDESCNINEEVFDQIKHVLFYLGALNVASEAIRPEVAAEVSCGERSFDEIVQRVRELHLVKEDFDIKTEVPKLTDAGFSLFKEILIKRQCLGWF